MNWLRIFCLWLAFFLGLFPYAHGVVPPPRPHYIYDVRYYGAKGDGLTNDQTAIENALTAAAATNGVVFVPEGVYLHDSVLVIPDSVTLMGFGELRSTDATTPSPQHAVILSGYGAELRDITISTTWAGANQSNNNGCGVLVNAAHNWVIDNVKVRNSATAGILSSGSVRGSITNCFVKNTLKDGIHMTNVTQDVLISGNRCDSTGDDGIAVVSYVSQGAKCDNIQITGNEVKNGSARGVAVVGGNNITISDNIVTNIVYAGLYVGSEASVTSYGSTNIQGSNNTLDSTGASSPSSYASIQIYGRADYPTENVKFEGGSASNCRYIGVTVSNPSEAIDSTTKNVRISGMTIKGAPGNNGFGLYAAGGTDITFLNNTIDHFASYGFACQAGEGAGDIRIIGNTFRDVDTVETGTEDIISLYNATYDAAYVMLNGAYEINDSTERFLQLNVDSIPTYYFYSNEMGALPSLPTQSILPDTLSSSQLGTVLTDEVGNSAGAKVMFSKGPNFLLLRGNNPTPTDEGDVQWDSSDHMIVVGNGGAASRFPDSDKIATMIGASGSVTAVYDSTARGHASGVNDTVWIDTLDATGGASWNWADSSFLGVDSALHAESALVAGSAYSADTATYLTSVSGDSQWVGFSKVEAALIPSQTDTFDIGVDGTLEFKDFYITGDASMEGGVTIGDTSTVSNMFKSGVEVDSELVTKRYVDVTANNINDTVSRYQSPYEPLSLPYSEVRSGTGNDSLLIHSSKSAFVLHVDSNLEISAGGPYMTLQGFYGASDAILGVDTSKLSDTSWFVVNLENGVYDTVWLTRDSIMGGASTGTDSVYVKYVADIAGATNGWSDTVYVDTADSAGGAGSVDTTDIMPIVRDSLNGAVGMNDKNIIGVQRLDVDSINGVTYGTIDLTGKVRFRLTDTSGTDSSITAPFADTVNTEPDNNDVYAWNSTSHRFEIKAQTGGAGEATSAINKGTTADSVFYRENVNELEFRRLKDSTGVIITPSGDTALSFSVDTAALPFDLYLPTGGKAADATKADSALKATQDAAGNVITTYYLPRGLFDDSVTATTAKIPTATLADSSKAVDTTRASLRAFVIEHIDDSLNEYLLSGLFDDSITATTAKIPTATLADSSKAVDTTRASLRAFVIEHIDDSLNEYMLSSLFDDSITATTAKIPTATLADSSKAVDTTRASLRAFVIEHIDDSLNEYMLSSLFDDSVTATTAKIPTATLADSSKKMDTTAANFTTYVANHAGGGGTNALDAKRIVDDTTDASVDKIAQWSSGAFEFKDTTANAQSLVVGSTTDRLQLRADSGLTIGDTTAVGNFEVVTNNTKQFGIYPAGDSIDAKTHDLLNVDSLDATKITDGVVDTGDLDITNLGTAGQALVNATGGQMSWQATAGAGRIARATSNLGPWNFLFDSTSNADSDPGVGKMKMNTTASQSISSIYIDTISLLGVNLGGIGVKHITKYTIIYLLDVNDPTNAQIFEVSSLPIVGGGYWKIPVTAGDSLTTGRFNNNDTVSFIVQPGLDIPNVVSEAQPLTFLVSSTTTDGDPSTGQIRFNNYSTQSSATQLYVDEVSAVGIGGSGRDVDSIISSLKYGDVIVLQKLTSGADVFQTWPIASATTDASGYNKINLGTNITSSGNFTALDTIVMVVYSDAPTWEYVYLDNVHGLGRALSDSIYLHANLETPNGDTTYLLRDSAGNITAGDQDTVNISGTVPYNCYIDSLSVYYVISSGSEIVDGWLKGPDKSSFTNLTDSIWAAYTTDLTSTSWAVSHNAVAQTALAGYRFTYKYIVQLDTDNDRLRIGWVRLKIKRN